MVREKEEGPAKWNWRRLLIVGFAGAVLITSVVHSRKPLPPGVSLEGPARPVGDLEFLFDITAGPRETGLVEQQIFHRVFSMISEAQVFVVLDMFLFNGSTGGEAAYRGLSVS